MDTIADSTAIENMVPIPQKNHRWNNCLS